MEPNTLTDGVLANDILISPCPLIPPTNEKKVRGLQKVRKQVTKCLQNLYQSVGIHMKYVLLVRLL